MKTAQRGQTQTGCKPGVTRLANRGQSTAVVRSAAALLLCAISLTACGPAEEDWAQELQLPAPGQLSADLRVYWPTSGELSATNTDSGNAAPFGAPATNTPATDKPSTNKLHSEAVLSGTGSASAMQSETLQPKSAGPRDSQVGMGLPTLDFGQALELDLLLAWPQEQRPAALDLTPWAAAAPRELSSEQRTRDGFVLERRRLRLRPTQLGELRLPALSFALRDDSAAPIAIEAPVFLVESSLPAPSADGAQKDPWDALPDLPPLPRRSWPWPWLLLPGGLLLWWWRKRRSVTPAQPAWLALAEAIASLRVLVAANAHEGTRAHAQLLVQLLRAYLIRAHGLPADQRTTPELIAQSALPPAAASALEAALVAADWQRFSAPSEASDALQAALNAAEAFAQAEAQAANSTDTVSAASTASAPGAASTSATARPSAASKSEESG